MGAARALARAGERILPRVPPAWQGPISEVAGTIAYLAAPRQRAAVRANLAMIAPGRSLSARRVFVNQVRQYLEVFQIPRLDWARFDAVVRVEGWDNFLCAQRLGKGVIFGSAHLGPVALVGQILITRGYTLTLPAEKTDSEFMHAVNRARQAQGMVLVPIDSALGVHRVIRESGVLGILADRAVTGIGERVDFFGRPALLPSAQVALALRTGAALVPAFAWREKGLLHARIEKPLELVSTGDRDADVRSGVRRFAAILELATRRSSPVAVIPGVEVTTRSGHLLALWIEEEIPMFCSLAEALSRVHEAGGVAIVPHPLSYLTFSIGEGALRQLAALGDGARMVDAIELRNPSYAGRVRASRAAWLNTHVLRVAATGSSDAHHAALVGTCWTDFSGDTSEDLRTALRAHQTTANGRGWTLREHLDGAAKQQWRSMVRDPIKRARRTMTRAGGVKNKKK